MPLTYLKLLLKFNSNLEKSIVYFAFLVLLGFYSRSTSFFFLSIQLTFTSKMFVSCMLDQMYGWIYTVLDRCQ